jgi:hypothetical protein
VNPDQLWPWLALAGTVLCAAAAGWAMGRSVPSWQEDAGNEWRTAGSHPIGYGDGWGSYSGGCEMLGCAMLLSGLRGNGWGALCAVCALVCAYFAWPPESWAGDSSQAGGGNGQLVLILFHPGFWTLLLSAAGGYVAAVTTDKGPVGPLE